jgi:hypothetical protein
LAVSHRQASAGCLCDLADTLPVPAQKQKHNLLIQILLLHQLRSGKVGANNKRQVKTKYPTKSRVPTHAAFMIFYKNS